MNLNRISFRKCSVAMCFAAGFIFSTYASAVQNAASFTSGARYNSVGQVTGTLSPDPDGRNRFPAVRNTYDPVRGVLVKVEQGSLTNWKNETYDPVTWTPSEFLLSGIQKLTYDDLGRKATVEVQDLSSNSQTLTQYAYDDFNRVQCIAVRLNPANYGSLPNACTLGTEGSFGPDRITQFTYNDIGQVTKETRAVGTSLAQDYVINTYNSIGQLTDEADANGNLTHLQYDTVGRLQVMNFPSKTTAGSYSTTDYEQYTYDDNGNRLSLRKRDGQIIGNSFDALNRPTTKTSSSGNVNYDYDLLGLKRSALFASNNLGTTNTFNGFGELKIEKNDVNGTTYTSNYSYNADGGRTDIIYPDGVAFKYNYDGLDRLTTITDNNSNGTSTLITNHYDDYARPDTQTTAGNAVTTLGYDSIARLGTLKYQFASTGYNLNLGFTYSPANQMLGKADNNTLYRYDQKASKTGSYSVNGLNEYTSVGGKTYNHDDNGNLIYDGDTNYSYDAENRLTNAISSSRNVTLNYDPSGRLYQFSSGGQTTYFLYNGDALIAEYQSGAMTKRYLFGSGVDKPLVSYNNTSVASSNRQFLHSNHQGSIIAASNTSGSVAYVNTYDAYGNPRTTNQGRFAYTGQTYFPELGMYYYKARMYAPAIGRFLQTDPIGYKDDYDLYSYVGDDPVNKTDPTGTTCESDGKNCQVDDAGKMKGTELKTVTKSYQTAVDKLGKGDQGRSVTINVNGAKFTVTAGSLRQALIGAKIEIGTPDAKRSAMASTIGGALRPTADGQGHITINKNILNMESPASLVQTFTHEAMHLDKGEEVMKDQYKSNAVKWNTEHHDPYNSKAYDLLKGE